MDPYPAAGFSLIYRFDLLLSIDPKQGTILFLLLLVLLTFSFLIAGNEAALFSLQPKDLEVLRTKQHPEARRIVRLMEQPQALYVSLLLAGTFLNICSILLLNFLFTEWLMGVALPHWLISLAILLLIVTIIYGVARLLPKVWASQQPIRFAHDFGFAAAGVYQLLQGVSRWLLLLAGKIDSATGADLSHQERLQEFDQEIDVRSEEELSPNEKMIMKSVVKFGNISVRQIMRSRQDISGIEYNTPLSEVLRQVAELHYSRLPVYRNDLDQVVGILNTKDLLPYVQCADSFDWHGLLRPPFFVPEPKPIEVLLKEFQQKRIHFAVVINESRATTGIVTMEDILEEVIGDIRDEFDEE